MLLEATYKDGDTISFKTVAGEEVVARLIKKEKDFYCWKITNLLKVS